MRAGEACAPLLCGPKAQVRKALEAAGIPHTYVVSYGFASYWANGLGELGQKNRVPPSPSTSNKVPFFGTGRTKCAPPHPALCLCISHGPSLILPSRTLAHWRACKVIFQQSRGQDGTEALLQGPPKSPELPRTCAIFGLGLALTF